MKAAIILLVLSVLGLGTAGGFFFRHATGVEQGLRAELADAAKREGELNSRLEDSKTQLSQAAQREADLASRLATTEGKLAATSEASSKSAAESAALAGLLSRKAVLEKAMDEDLKRAFSKVEETQTAWFARPSVSGAKAFKRALEQMLSAAEKLNPVIDEMAAFIEANGAHLTASADVISKIQAKIGASRPVLNFSILEIKNCLASFREASLGVMAREGWQQMDLTLKKGEIFVVAAEGTWSYAPIRNSSVGPAGENWTTEYRVIPDCANGALIGRIHGGESVVLAGQGYQADRAGKLAFRINDSVLDDNRGTIEVTVWAFAAPTLN